MQGNMGGKLDNIEWYDHVSKLVETGREGKITVLWSQKCEPTELLLTINWRAQCVIINKEHACCNYWRQKCDQERS